MYLLDTDVLIYSLKGHPAVLAALKRRREEAMSLSVVSLMELHYGARKSQRVESNLAKVRALASSFEVIPLTQDCAETFGELKAALEAQGARLDDLDLAIAATALSRNLTLVHEQRRPLRACRRAETGELGPGAIHFPLKTTAGTLAAICGKSGRRSWTCCQRSVPSLFPVDVTRGSPRLHHVKMRSPVRLAR